MKRRDYKSKETSVLNKEKAEKKEVVDTINVLFKSRQIPKYEIPDTDDHEDLIQISLGIYEKRKNSIESLLYSNLSDKKNIDNIVNGEETMIQEERLKYLNYLIEKHKKCLPKELIKDKLTRSLGRSQNKVILKKDKKVENKVDEDKEDNNLNIEKTPEIDIEQEDFEDLIDVRSNYQYLNSLSLQKIL